MNVINIQQSMPEPQNPAVASVEGLTLESEFGVNEFTPSPLIESSIAIEIAGSEDYPLFDFPLSNCPTDISECGRFTKLMMPRFLTGVVVLGRQEARSLGYPTANLQLSHEVVAECALALHDGSYCCFVKNERDEKIYQGVALWRKSKQQNAHLFEVHLIDAVDHDFYGDVLVVAVCGYMRSMWGCRPFKRNVARQQIRDDVAHARKMLETPQAEDMKKDLCTYQPNTSGLSIPDEDDIFSSLGLLMHANSTHHLTTHTPLLTRSASFSMSSESSMSRLPSVHISSECIHHNHVTDDDIAQREEELFEAFHSISKGRVERFILDLIIEFAYTCSGKGCSDKSFNLYYCNIHDTYECFLCWQKNCCSRSGGCTLCTRKCPECQKLCCSNCFASTQDTCEVCSLRFSPFRSSNSLQPGFLGQL